MICYRPWRGVLDTILIDKVFIMFNDYRRGLHGRDRIVVGFTATYAISAYHN